MNGRVAVMRATRLLLCGGVPGIALTVCFCALHLVNPEIPPQVTGEQVWQRLARLRSFSFWLRYRAGRPLDVQADFKGVWQSSDRELWVGHLRRSGVVTNVRMVGDGAVQYELSNGRGGCGLFARNEGQWQRNPRGVATRILDQLRAVMQSTTLSYFGDMRGQHLFTFTTVIPLLDPMRQREVHGLLRVSRRTGLPESVRCVDDSGITIWEVGFGSFDCAAQIEVPFVPASYLVMEPERRVALWQVRCMRTRLQDRFRLLGWRYRLHRQNCHRFRLYLDHDLPQSLVQLVLSQGVVELWSAETTGLSSVGDSVKCVAGDAAKRVVLRRLLGRNGSLRLQLDLSVPIDPALIVYFPSGDTSTVLLALLVGKECIGVARPMEDGGARFTDIGREDYIRVVSAIAAANPLPAGWRIIEYGHR